MLNFLSKKKKKRIIKDIDCYAENNHFFILY